MHRSIDMLHGQKVLGNMSVESLIQLAQIAEAGALSEDTERNVRRGCERLIVLANPPHV